MVRLQCMGIDTRIGMTTSASTLASSWANAREYDHACEEHHAREHQHARARARRSRRVLLLLPLGCTCALRHPIPVHQHWLKHIWFVVGAEPAFFVELALSMEPKVFTPSEVPEGSSLYIIQSGVVLLGSSLQNVLTCNGSNIAHCVAFLQPAHG